VKGTTVAVGGQLVDIRGRAGEYDGIYLPLYGDHQAQNAAVAVAAVESFLGDGTRPLAQDVVTEGLGSVTSPGRLQLVGIEPTILVDAAHNPHGAAALRNALTEYFDFDEWTFVIGVLADKDAPGIFAELAPIAERFHVTHSSSPRAIGESELARIALAASHEDAVYQYGTLEHAMEQAREWASQAPKRGIVVTGSITLVGDAIQLAEREGWKGSAG
jgi:dihydrofolate synthase/folylpolyglutamate synthase